MEETQDEAPPELVNVSQLNVTPGWYQDVAKFIFSLSLNRANLVG